MWEKLGTEVNEEGTTITYVTPDSDMWIQSRKRHIPHANRSGTWDHTFYFVMRLGVDVEYFATLKDAKAYVEQKMKEEN